VVGDMLIASPSRASGTRVLGQIREAAETAPDIPPAPAAPDREPK
jgi:hypothetical protein